MYVPGHVHTKVEAHRAVLASASFVRTARRPAVRSVLFASSGQHESAALQHTEVLAQSLHAELHVLRVLTPARPFLPALGRFFGARDSREEVNPCRAAARRAATWCDDVLSQPLPERRLAVRVGDFVSQVVEHARTLDDPVIVLPPSRGRLGSTATTLACASLRSVLVVRAWARAVTVLVATGLEKGDTSVLQLAHALGEQLRAPVVAVHNVTRIASTVSVGSPLLAPLLLAPVPVPTQGPLDEARVAQVKERLAPVPTVVTNELDLADAIIGQARRYRAHTIVVGTRPRSWIERLINPSIAAAVVDGADHSVLVMPRLQ
jgi:nucleotide-binding universal stress UspA family protein